MYFMLPHLYLYDYMTIYIIHTIIGRIHIYLLFRYPLITYNIYVHIYYIIHIDIRPIVLPTSYKLPHYFKLKENVLHIIILIHT